MHLYHLNLFLVLISGMAAVMAALDGNILLTVVDGAVAIFNFYVYRFGKSVHERYNH